MYPHERSLVESMQGRPFALIGVNSDASNQTALNAVKKNNLNWRSFYMGRGGGKPAKDYKVKGWPTIVLIDHNGIVQKCVTGGRNLDQEIEALVSIAESDGGDPTPIPFESSGETGPSLKTFSSASGKFTVDAEFVKFEGGKVYLKKEDGEEIQVKMGQLKSEDQKWIRDELKRRRSGG